MSNRTLCAFTFTAATALVSALGCSRSSAPGIPPAQGALSESSSAATGAATDGTLANDLFPAVVPRVDAARPEVHWFARPLAPGSTVLYVSNYHAGTVDVFAGGKPPMTAQIVHLGAPSGLAVDANGNLYVAEMAHHDVLEFPPSLTAVIRNFAVGGRTGNGNESPLGIAVTPDGSTLYVAEANRDAGVEIFKPPQRTLAGYLSDPSLAGGALYPAVDTAGTVYVTYRPTASAATFALGTFMAGGAFATATLAGNPVAVRPLGNGNLLVDDLELAAGTSSLETYVSGAKTPSASSALPFASEAFAVNSGTTDVFAAALRYRFAEVPYPAGSPSAIAADGDSHDGIAVYPPAALGAPWKPFATPSPTPSPTNSITEYPVPTANSEPGFIAAGADGALWFTEINGNKIGRITTTGRTTEYPVPAASSLPYDIAAGPDGALWFTEFFGNNIGRITTAGTFTEYPVPKEPEGIAAGPDGALWSTEQYAGDIGRMTTAGTITEYPEPKGADAVFLAAGPDGAVWFADFGGSKIDRITTAGTITEFPTPTAGSNPLGITAGPDGALWFTESSGSKIGRITTAGAITEYPIPTADSVPYGIAVGPDGTLWFTEFRSSKIGRITTAGTIAEFPTPTANSLPYGITGGPDGALWFTEEGGNNIGRIPTTIAARKALPARGGGGSKR